MSVSEAFDFYEPQESSGAYSARLEAECGITALLNHCLRAYDHFAAAHKITRDEARILLLETGVRL